MGLQLHHLGRRDGVRATSFIETRDRQTELCTFAEVDHR